MAGDHGVFASRRDRDRRRAGVVPARLGAGIAFGVVPELTERPGAEHFTESWLGEVDPGVRVLLKAGSEVCFEFADVAVQFSDDTDQCPHGCPVCVGDRARSGELAGAKPLLDSAGNFVEVASPSAGSERGSDLGDGQTGSCAGGWCPAQHGQSVAMGQVIESFQRCRIVFARRALRTWFVWRTLAQIRF